MHILCKKMLRRLKKKEGNPIKVLSFDRQELLELHVTYKGSLFSSSFAEALLQLLLKVFSSPLHLILLLLSLRLKKVIQRHERIHLTTNTILYPHEKHLTTGVIHPFAKKLRSNLLFSDLTGRGAKKGSRKSGPKVILTLNPSLKFENNDRIRS